MTERIRSEHIAVVGSYGAGKTSLMAEVARQSEGEYYVERNHTYRDRRPGEGDGELIFVPRDVFDARRLGFLTMHRQRGAD